MISVLSWGVAGSVVDAGHPGRAWLGASRGGAVDRVSHALANRLVGNPDDAGGFESSGGLVLRADTAMLVAMTGGVAAIEVDGGPPIGWGSPIAVPAGAVVRVGRLFEGARCYVALRGGVRLDHGVPVVGPAPDGRPATQPAPRVELRTVVRLWPGPRRHWFSDDAWTTLLTTAYVVSDTSRVGTRLRGPALTRTTAGELPPEGVVEGAVQVPADGQPIVMLADHPTTGGYPVIAVVHPSDVHHVAQAAPGTSLRFTAASPMHR
jgi:allophanate hydrolase subunit 2